MWTGTYTLSDMVRAALTIRRSSSSLGTISWVCKLQELKKKKMFSQNPMHMLWKRLGARNWEFYLKGGNPLLNPVFFVCKPLVSGSLEVQRVHTLRFVSYDLGYKVRGFDGVLRTFLLIVWFLEAADQRIAGSILLSSEYPVLLVSSISFYV